MGQQQGLEDQERVEFLRTASGERRKQGLTTGR